MIVPFQRVYVWFPPAMFGRLFGVSSLEADWARPQRQRLPPRGFCSSYTSDRPPGPLKERFFRNMFQGLDAMSYHMVKKNKHIGLRNCRCATELGLSAIPSVQCDAGCRTWIRTWQGRKSGINWVKLIILSSTIPTNHYKWIYIYIKMGCNYHPPMVDVYLLEFTTWILTQAKARCCRVFNTA